MKTTKNKVWKKHTIDYQHGKAYLFCFENMGEEKLLGLFYSLASQCFGIRKSLGETILVETEECEFPNEVTAPKHLDYDSPLQLLMSSIKHHKTVPANKAKKICYMLVHSGGDLIAWDENKKKIISEYDD